MAVVKEIIKANDNGTLSFGNYELNEKTKINDFEFNGRFYKAKTFNEVTKLKRDGALVFESLPGSAVHAFKVTDEEVTFNIKGSGATQITLELQPETEYKLIVDEIVADHVRTSISGKINFSMELGAAAKEVAIKKLV